MKLRIIEFLFIISFTVSIRDALCDPEMNEVVTGTTLDTSLAKDLHEIQQIIPTKDLYRLVLRYLLNDEEFQRIVRTLMSRNTYVIIKHFRLQPEVTALKQWTRMQLLLDQDHDVSSMETSSELKDVMKVMQTLPVMRGTGGWNGFLDEFFILYPEDLLRAHIDMKVQQNGVFAQFWQRVRYVKAAYERVLLMPEAQEICKRLQEVGVDTRALDAFIRRQFDW